ncbi:MAG: S8 family peptidase [Phycisphaerae bacterium]
MTAHGTLAQTLDPANAGHVDALSEQTRQLRDNEFAAAREAARQSPTGLTRILVGLDVPEVETLRIASAIADSIESAAAADEVLARTIRDAADATIAALGPSKFVMHRVLRTAPAFSISASVETLDALESLPEVVVALRSMKFRPNLDQTTVLTGAAASWTNGHDGTGTFVAILDSGILRTHEMFAGKTIIEACFAGGDEVDPFVGDCPNGQEEQFGTGAAAPHPSRFSGFDHGTHVAGIAAGAAFDPSDGPLLHGVARGADIIMVQVFSREDDAADCEPNEVDCIFANPDDFAAGLEHVYSLRLTRNIAAVNMSLGGGSLDDQTACDVVGFFVKPVIDNLRTAGIATVISSGNEELCNGIGFPACISSAIAVGATDDFDNEASFSNHHALLDIYAPGVGVDSATAVSNTSHDEFDGTSMAAPHVTGAFALIRDAVGVRTVSTIFECLRLTGRPVDGRCVPVPNQRRIQIDAAVTAAQMDTWVDFTYVGVEAGGITTQWDSFGEGTSFVPTDGTLAFKAGQSSEIGVISRAMTMRSFDGSTVIGE